MVSEPITNLLEIELPSVPNTVVYSPVFAKVNTIFFVFEPDVK